MSQGIIDYPLGIVLSIAMFIGGLIGGRLSLSLSNIWLQRIYLMAVGVLAVITFRKSQTQTSS
ncbi:MAG: hypothetical protein MET45_08485 [Nostoc sp. LLA-1]|nr:hypothetical protein [Cyanocohniella sp. LLY]